MRQMQPVSLLIAIPDALSKQRVASWSYTSFKWLIGVAGTLGGSWLHAFETKLYYALKMNRGGDFHFVQS